MILVDSSAWIEYLRATGSATHHRLRDIIEAEEPLGTTEVVIMEILAGARDRAHAERLRRLLYRCRLLGLTGVRSYEEAAELYRVCRSGGETVRKLTDCLIATVALRDGVALLHRDSDFDVIARHAPLRLDSGGAT